MGKTKIVVSRKAVTARPKAAAAEESGKGKDWIKFKEFDNRYGLADLIQLAQKLNRSRKTAEGERPKITLAQLNELSAMRRMGPADETQHEDFLRKFRAFMRSVLFDITAIE